MAIFRKKPSTIEAWLWDETNTTLDIIGCGCQSRSGHVDRPNEVTNLRIKTMEGTQSVKKGDYITKDIAGFYRPISSESFNSVYEKIGS